jgi:hypothetical protein
MAVQALGGSAPALGKVSTGRRASVNLLGLSIWHEGALERCGDDGVRKLGFLLLLPKSEAKQALYIGLFVQRSPIRVGLYLQAV